MKFSLFSTFVVNFCPSESGRDLDPTLADPESKLNTPSPTGSGTLDAPVSTMYLCTLYNK